MEYYSNEARIYNIFSDDPFKDIPRVFTVEVTEGKRTRDLISNILFNLRKGHPVKINGFGRETERVIRITEIVKSKYKSLYQLTHLDKISTIEVYSPLLPDLDAIEIKRSVPLLSILMSIQLVEGLKMSKTSRIIPKVHLSQIQYEEVPESVPSKSKHNK